MKVIPSRQLTLICSPFTQCSLIYIFIFSSFSTILAYPVNECSYSRNASYPNAHNFLKCKDISRVTDLHTYHENDALHGNLRDSNSEYRRTTIQEFTCQVSHVKTSFFTIMFQLHYLVPCTACAGQTVLSSNQRLQCMLSKL